MKKTGLLVLLLILSLLTIQPLFAQTESSSNPKVSNKMDLACVQKAVEKRESAIIAAHEQLSTSIKSALEQRKTALIQAWGIAKLQERVKARVGAWNNFRKARREARKVYNNAVKSAWKQFKEETKGSCKVSTQGVEPEGTDLSVVE